VVTKALKHGLETLQGMGCHLQFLYVAFGHLHDELWPNCSIQKEELRVD
jgi:hypothetical protein